LVLVVGTGGGCGADSTDALEASLAGDAEIGAEASGAVVRAGKTSVTDVIGVGACGAVGCAGVA
jgi:hypothetical protein